MVIKNLAEVSKEEQIEFINSFDRLLVDMDGVIWLAFVPILDAQVCLHNFQKLGKQVTFVTNLATSSREVTIKRLHQHNFNYQIEDIMNPCIAAIDYLKKIHFQKKIFAISTESYKEELRNVGFNILEDPPQKIEETPAVLFQSIQDDEDIGAVLFDWDINLTYLKMQKALTYLKRPDCLFIIGGADKKLPIGLLGPLLGNYYIYQGLIEISGRQPIQLAKPSQHYNKFISDKLNLTNPERVLFIGDMINEDMGFAAEGGYKKLLVLSGATKIEDIKNWKHPDKYKPDYYIDSLTELNKIIRTIHKL